MPHSVILFASSRAFGNSRKIAEYLKSKTGSDFLDITGLEIDRADLETLTSIDPQQWKAEMAGIAEYLSSYGDRLPAVLREQLQVVTDRLAADSIEKAS